MPSSHIRIRYPSEVGSQEPPYLILPFSPGVRMRRFHSSIISGPTSPILRCLLSMSSPPGLTIENILSHIAESETEWLNDENTTS